MTRSNELSCVTEKVPQVSFSIPGVEAKIDVPVSVMSGSSKTTGVRSARSILMSGTINGSI